MAPTLGLRRCWSNILDGSPGSFENALWRQTVKKLLVLAIIVGIAYFGYKKFLDFAFSDKGLTEIVASANKEFPKDLPNGARLEKLEVEPGKRVVQRMKLPVASNQLDPSRTPRMNEFACKDKVGRYMLDHGVTWIFIVQDNMGTTVLKEEVTKANC